MGRVKLISTLNKTVSFSHPECDSKNVDPLKPCYTKIKKQQNTRGTKSSRRIVEYESCCIDGFLIHSFATAEEQQEFSPLTALKVLPSSKHTVAITPKVTNTPKILEEEIVFVDCGFFVEENQDVTASCQKYRCASCDQAFVFQSSLEFHLRNALPINSVELKCEFCTHISYGSDTMRMHVRHLHGKRLYDQFSSDELTELFDEQISACESHFPNEAHI